MQCWDVPFVVSSCVMPCRVVSCLAELCYVVFSFVMPCLAESCCVVLCIVSCCVRCQSWYVMSCIARSCACRIIPCCIVSRYIVLFHVMYRVVLCVLHSCPRRLTGIYSDKNFTTCSRGWVLCRCISRVVPFGLALRRFVSCRVVLCCVVLCYIVSC